MSNVLVKWIKDSKHWKSAKAFNVVDRQVEEYEFLKRTDDYYISLFNKMFKWLKNERYLVNEEKESLLSVAKGLEIYSLDETRSSFYGVNYAENILYASSIYYLTGYYTTSVILANMFSISDYSNELDKFIYCFLINNRHIDEGNTYLGFLNSYLNTGDEKHLNNLLLIIEEKLEDADMGVYVSLLLAKCLILKFKSDNIWLSMKNSNPEVNWTEFVKSKLDFLWVLFPSQNKALEKGILTKDETFSLQMPTSSGKTALCEVIIYNEVIFKKRKVLILAPYRALASELNKTFRKNFEGHGIIIKTLYGGHAPTLEEKSEIENVDLLICTPEKFMALENYIPNIHKLFSTIICDEGHLLDDQDRGLNYELLLAKLKKIDDSSITRKYIYISAIIPNLNDINRWLGGSEDTIIKSEYRPIQLNYGFLQEMGQDKKYFDLNMQSLNNEELNFSIHNLLNVEQDYKFFNTETKRINTYNYKSYKAKAVSIALKALTNGSVIIYTPQKGIDGVLGLAEEIVTQIDKLNFPKPVEFSSIKNYEVDKYFDRIFGKDYILSMSIRNGFAVHHGDLPQFAREIVEDCVRNRIIPLLICTNTLAEGVNLPIKTIVLHTVKRFNPSLGYKEFIRKRDIKNIVGRAGRAGQETEGIVISINTGEYEYIQEVINENEIEPVKGFLYHLIEELTAFIKEDRFILSNEIIEIQDESVQKIIDSIDKSIIDALYEEIEGSDFPRIIEDIINRTFSFFQADETQKVAIKGIYLLRSNKISSYSNSQLEIIKKSGASIRIYEYLIEIINFNDEIWLNASLAEIVETLEYLLEIVFNLKNVISDLDNFNSINKGNILTKEMIKRILMEWVNCSWYADIANKFEIQVDYVLKIMLFIESKIVPIISTIIVMCKNELLDEGKFISSDFEKISTTIQFGVNSKLHCTLIEIGFNERMGLLLIVEWLKLKFHDLDDLNKTTIKGLLKINQDEISEFIAAELPKIALDKFQIVLKNI